MDQCQDILYIILELQENGLNVKTGSPDLCISHIADSGCPSPQPMLLLYGNLKSVVQYSHYCSEDIRILPPVALSEPMHWRDNNGM